MSEPKVLWVVGAAIVDEQGRIFAAQRPEGGAHALEWEFPGGKVEAGESPQEALARELHEELGVRARIGGFVARGEVVAGDRLIRLDVYFARVLEGEIELKEHASSIWLERGSLGELDWAEADLPAVSALSDDSVVVNF